MIAVSFCNQPDDAGGILALLDERTDERRWLDCGDLALQSGVGLAEADGLLYCACTDGDASYLAIFDASGTRRELRRLDAVSDIHSICIDGDDLFAVSTGTDEVVRHSLRTGAPPETVWSPSQARRAATFTTTSAAQVLCRRVRERPRRTAGIHRQR